MATKTFKVSLSLDNPRIIQSGINVHSFDKQSIKISIELTKNSQVYQIPTDAQIKISLLKLARQEQKIILDVPFTSADSIDWIVPDYLDGYQGDVRVGVYLIVGTENIDVGYFNITSSVSDIDSAAEEFTESVLQGWAIEDLTALLPKFQEVIDETTGKDVISAPEIILARNSEVDLKTRLDKEKQEVTAQLAQTLTQRQYHYYVGAKQKYKTIQSAVNKWITDGRPKATVHLMSGIYNESISILEGGTLPYRLSFIGEDKRNTIWKTTNGYYKDAPLHYHGDCVIEGITFIADHSENPSYAYSNLGGNVWTDNVGGAYALHADFNSEGTMLIKDCDLISYQNAALGSGTRKNQTIKLENVNMWSYTENTTGSEQQLLNGALLYHSFSGAGATNQKLSLKNVFAFSENGRPLTISNFSPEVGAFEVEMINSNFASNVVTDRALLLKFNPGAQTELPITQNSYGNNIERFNVKYANELLSQKPPLTTEAGFGIIATDLNDITKTQYFQINTNGANIPLPGVAWAGECIAYSSTYVVQHAWQITDVAQKYKRYLKGATWSTWKKVTETAFNMGEDGFAFNPNANSANNCRLNGVYKCTVATPTEGVPFLVQVIAHDLSYAVQYAWQLSNMTKYKRTLINGSWGTWIEITEP